MSCAAATRRRATAEPRPLTEAHQHWRRHRRAPARRTTGFAASAEARIANESAAANEGQPRITRKARIGVGQAAAIERGLPRRDDSIRVNAFGAQPDAPLFIGIAFCHHRVMSAADLGDVRVKRCARCGSPFDCCAGGCWCGSVELSAAARTTLQQQFSDCLCPTCLRRYAVDASGVSSPGNDGPRQHEKSVSDSE